MKNWSKKFEGKKVLVSGLHESNADEWDYTDEEYEEMLKHDEEIATIKWLACDVDGTFENGYWTIEFEDGFMIEAISAYLLQLI